MNVKYQHEAISWLSRHKGTEKKRNIQTCSRSSSPTWHTFRVTNLALMRLYCRYRVYKSRQYMRTARDSFMEGNCTDSERKLNSVQIIPSVLFKEKLYILKCTVSVLVWLRPTVVDVQGVRTRRGLFNAK